MIRRHEKPKLYSSPVEPGHVFLQSLPERIVVLVFKLVAVEHLLLQEPEEVLGWRVVEAVSLSRHRLSYAVVGEPRLIHLLLVLPALVRMQYGGSGSDDPGLSESLQHVHRLPEVRMTRDAVADDSAGAEVDDWRQVDLPEGQLELGYVRAHLESGHVGLEIPVYDVGANLADLALVGIVSSPSEGGPVAHPPEDAPDLVAADDDSLCLQGQDDSPGAVDLVLPYRQDLQYGSLGGGVGVFVCGMPDSPVERGSGHSDEAQIGADANLQPSGLILCKEAQLHCLLFRPSFAKA